MSTNLSQIKSLVSTRTWSQLSNNEKDIIIEKIIDCPDLIKHKYIMSIYDLKSENAISEEADAIQIELYEKYGINASIYYDLTYGCNYGFTFETNTLVAHAHFLEALNYENLFDNKDEKYQAALRSYITQMKIDMSRNHLSLMPQDSIIVSVTNYNEDVETLLLNNIDEEELNENNENVKMHREWYTLFSEKLQEKIVAEFLNNWVADYSEKCFIRLLKVASSQNDKFKNIASGVIENAGYFTNHGDSSNEEVKVPRYIFENQDEDINMIEINN